MSKDLFVSNETLKQLAELLTECGLTEIEVEEGDKRVRVAKKPARVSASVEQVAHHTVPATPTVSAAPVTESTDNAAAKASAGAPVKAPLVGTAYLAPEPGAPNFVSVGSKVNEGDTLLIIEAMKVMNPVKATKSGVVKEILVQNAAPVEFDEVLLYIE